MHLDRMISLVTLLTLVTQVTDCSMMLPLTMEEADVVIPHGFNLSFLARKIPPVLPLLYIFFLANK